MSGPEIFHIKIVLKNRKQYILNYKTSTQPWDKNSYKRKFNVVSSMKIYAKMWNENIKKAKIHHYMHHTKPDHVGHLQETQRRLNTTKSALVNSPH